MLERERLGKRGGLLAAAGTLLRAWLPSLLVHAALLSALGLVAYGVGQIGDLLEQERAVSIVLRDDRTSGEIRYRDQQDVQLADPSAPQTPVGEAQALDTSVISSLDRQTQEHETLDAIGLGSLSGGGEAGGFSALGGGATGGAQFFGLRSPGSEFVYVVDRSGSMRQNGAMAAAKRELVESLRALPRGSRFHVLFYSSRSNHRPSFVEAPARRLLRTSSANLQEVEEWIAGIEPYGGTDPQTALLRALELEPDAIFFLTDGQFQDRVVDEISRANTTGTAIMAVSFSQLGEALLKRLARLNNGRYRFVQP